MDTTGTAQQRGPSLLSLGNVLAQNAVQSYAWFIFGKEVSVQPDTRFDVCVSRSGLE